MSSAPLDVWWTFLIATTILTIVSISYVATLVVSHRRYVRMQSQQTEELRKREERFRLLVERSSDALILFSSSGQAVYASPNAEKVIGYSLQDPSVRNPLDLIHPSDRQHVAELATEVLQSAGSTLTAQCRIQDGNGSWKPIELIATNLLDEPSVRAIVVNCRDITERKQAEEDLKRLAKRVIEVQESESKRLAGELHDSIGQMLHSAKILVDSSQDGLKQNRRTVRRSLRDASRILDKTIREVRRLLRNLRPATLDKLGLYPAVRAVCEEFRVRTGIDLELKQKGLPDCIPADVKLALYRIIQESLANVEKHSKATRASIHLEVEGSVLRVSIKDNGKGFSRSHLPRSKKEAHLGLIDMKERASYIGGELSIRSDHHQGTEITVQIPIERLTLVENN